MVVVAMSDGIIAGGRRAAVTEVEVERLWRMNNVKREMVAVLSDAL